MKSALAKQLLEQLKKFFKDHPKGMDLISSLEEIVLNEMDTDLLDQREKLSGDSPIKLYSDGACRGNPGPGAWAAVGIKTNQEGKDEVFFEKTGLDVSTTNNRMELIGATEALKEILSYTSLQMSDTKVQLYSDSKYVVDGSKSWMKGWKKRGWKKSDGKSPENLELWQDLDEVIGDIPNLELIWVKGHVGNQYNEKCDQMANEALDDAGF